MKVIIVLMCSVLFGYGIYKCIYATGKYPSRKSRKAMKKSAELVDKKSLMERLEPLILKVATKISRFLPMNPLKEQELKNMLIDVDLPYDPKVFISRSIVIAVAIGVFAIPFLLFFPLGALGVLLVDFLIVSKEMGKVYDITKKRKEIIEMELPRFTQHLALAIPNTSNVRDMLEQYRPMAGKTFGKELTRTLADIKTSDLQGSLLRMEQRVGSSMLSEIIRALCSVDNGIDQGQHFNMLAFNYRDKQNQLIRKEALKRPDKISTLAFLGVIGVLAQILVLLGSQFAGVFSTFSL